MKINTKFNIGFLIAAFLPFVTMLLFTLVYSEYKLEQMIQEKSLVELNTATLLFQQNITQIKEMAGVFSELPTIVVPFEYQLHKKLEPVLHDLQQQYNFASIGIIDQHARVISPTSFNIKDTSYPLAPLPPEPTTYLEKIHDTSYVTTVTPIFTRNKDALLGALIIRQGLYRLTKRGDHSILMTIFEDVTCEYLREYRAEYQKTVCHPIKDFQGQDIAAFVVRFYTIPYVLFRRHSLLILAVIGGGGLLVIVLLRFLLTRALIRPLLALKATVDDIQNGKYSARTHLSGYDELGRLGRHFNAMAEQIQASLQQCIRLNEQLEHTVESRTAELNQTNQQLRETLQHLKTTQAQLLAQEKLANLGELTAGIAHELKNPLNFVSSFSQIISDLARDAENELAKETPEQQELSYIVEKLPEFARKIQEHSDRAVRIINGMLEQTRGGKGTRIPTHLNRLVKEYVALAYHGMRAQDGRFNTEIQEEYDPVLDELRISVIPREISRALLNMLMNACYELNRKQHAMNSGYVPVLRVSTEDAGSDVVIRIRDNGDGIPEALREKIFQPFFSTKPAGEGTGLGLSMAYEIIANLHQGTLEVVSQTGEFTEFIIRLSKFYHEDTPARSGKNC